jgi:predicted AlkP superfamily pyrophosphatase or phosphodiesterase
MFARGYFPGRSGQVFVVPREGDVITERGELYPFMHGSPWDYDTRIPMLLHGQPFVRSGSFDAPAAQQDVAPTLAALLGTPPAATMSGRVLREALATGGGRPRVIAVVVLDGMRADFFDRYAAEMPTLARLKRDGAWFAEARATALPTVTSVGHATIGTGADPRVHGLASNTVFNRATGKAQPAYLGLDPGELMALTIGDLWNLVTDGRAVIVGQGGAIRATAGLVGRGACLVGARPVIAASYSTRDAGWETNPTCYRMPDYLKAINGKTFWEAAGGTWKGHDIANPTSFRASSVFQRFEGDALMAVIEHEPFGADEVTDLLMVNMKGPDYIGHAYGPDAPETRDTLAELDRQMARVLDALGRKAGANGVVTVITSDHGMPAEPAPPGHRHYGDDVVKRIHDRFDPEGRTVLQYASDTANSQIYLDTARLNARGFSLKDVATFLASLDFIAAAFTEDEVRSTPLP